MLKMPVALLLGVILGAMFMRMGDIQTVREAQQNEDQANGLEDECQATLRAQSHYLTAIPLVPGQIHSAGTLQ